jgi:hypothetical protein
VPFERPLCLASRLGSVITRNDYGLLGQTLSARLVSSVSNILFVVPNPFPSGSSPPVIVTLCRLPLSSV